MERDRATAVVLAALVMLGGIPAGVAALADTAATQQAGEVNVTTGQQLSTVLSVTSDDVRSEVNETAFEAEYESAADEQRAEAIADRAEQLRERAAAVREAYEEATAAYRDGELTRSEYAQRLATLNARAENVAAAAARLADRADDVSKLELRAAGLNRSALRDAVEGLDTVRGAGPSALLQRFTGETEGEIRLETDGGLSLSVESEDGERSRELERAGDGSTNLTVSQSEALDVARGNLSAVNGTWLLTDTGIDREDGAYEFGFRLDGSATEGEAEVTVDGSSGAVVSLEEELEPREETENGDEDREGSNLALVLDGGTLAPGETVTVKALAGGEPAANVTVSIDDRMAGDTGSDGTLQVRLPDGDEAELTATRGEAEAELELDLGEEADDDGDEEIRRNLDADVALDGGTATVTVTYDDSGVANATVYANGRRVGTTGSDGTASFEVSNDTDELEIRIMKGEFEAEFEFDLGEQEPREDEDRERDDEEEDNEDRERDDEEEDDENEDD